MKQIYLKYLTEWNSKETLAVIVLVLMMLGFVLLIIFFYPGEFLWHINQTFLNGQS